MDTLTALLQTDGTLRACWLGNNSWIFAHAGHLIATDIALFLPERKLPPYAQLPDLAKHLDYLCITHGHTDHFGPDTVRKLMTDGPCTLILPESCRGLALSYRLDDARIWYVQPGQTLNGLPSWVDIQTLRALHGHLHGSIYHGANLQDCGYLFTFGGKRILQPGDTVLLEEHLALQDIDILLVSPTEHNMGIQQAALYIETIRPKTILAQHFGTYHETEENAFWAHGYPSELKAALSPEMQARFIIPAYDQPINLS